jgi:hypothetical protein
MTTNEATRRAGLATWGEMAAAAPRLAERGRALLMPTGTGDGLLATVRGEAPPRIHPVSFEIADGELLVFVLRSAKLVDLEQDGRYALHANIDEAAPSEFMVRGVAREVSDPAARAAAAQVWSFSVDDSYRLFALDIASASLGERPNPHAWPPVYTRWTATRRSADGESS